MAEATESTKTVLIFGGHGLVGTALAQVYAGAGATVVRPRSAACDIRDLAAVRAEVARCGATLLINSAAISAVDRAEQAPDEAYQVNAVGAHNLALAAAEADLPLVQISTDFVFDGRRRSPYREYHPVGEPPNHYGRSKVLAEELVRACWRRHFIVRIAAVFGAGRPGFVDWAVKNADPAAPLTIVCDRFASPTWSDDAARQIEALTRTPYYGTYHATGQGACSFYELARTAVTLAGGDPDGVRPIHDAELPSPARRAVYTALDNHLLRLRGLDTMLPWQRALAAFLEQRGDGPAA